MNDLVLTRRQQKVVSALEIGRRGGRLEEVAKEWKKVVQDVGPGVKDSTHSRPRERERERDPRDIVKDGREREGGRPELVGLVTFSA